MSRDEDLKQIRETLAQLSVEIREGSRHEARNILLSATAGAVFVLAMSWMIFRLFS